MTLLHKRTHQRRDRYLTSSSLRVACVLLLSVLGAQIAVASEGYTPVLSLSGEAPAALSDDIKNLAEVFTKAKDPLPDPTALETRLTTDQRHIKTLLENAGYYDNVITIKDTRADDQKITLEVDVGPRYQLARYTLTGQQAALPLPTPDALGLKLNCPALATDLEAAELKTLDHLAEQGYPLARFTTRTYIVDHATKTLEAVLAVDGGPKVSFGDVRFSGLERTHPHYLLNRRPWDSGQVYSTTQLKAYQKALLDTDLFSSVKLTPAQNAAPDGSLPIEATLVERKPRSYGGSAGYSTDQGAGVTAFWSHRNLWGNGEKLDVTGKGYAKNQSLKAALRTPDLPDKRTTFLISLEAFNEHSSAYNASGLKSEIGFERQMADSWKISAGTRLFYGNVDNTTVIDMALPLIMTIDNTDNLLDPTTGWRATSSFTPNIALAGSQALYATWEQRISGYHRLTKSRSVVIAGWAHAGGVLFADTKDIPPTSRFYAGGGGSVRGYAYRSIGEKDASGDPLGGTALLEGGGELRVRFSDTWGGVLFAEGGAISATTVPTPSRPQYAAGIGVRYLTSIAPLRFDIGVPLNPRASDASYQIYLSLGQAF